MSEPTLYRTHPSLSSDTVAMMIQQEMLVPVEPQECKLMQSEPQWIGRRGGTWDGYRIILKSDKPADSLTMHGKVWLIGDTDE